MGKANPKLVALFKFIRWVNDPWLIACITSICVPLQLYGSPLLKTAVATLAIAIAIHLYVNTNRKTLYVQGDKPTGWLGAGDSLLLVNVLPPNLGRMTPELVIARLLRELEPLCKTGPPGGGENPPCAVVVSEDDEQGFPLYRYPAQPLRALYERRKRFAQAPTVAAIRDSATRAALGEVESGVANVPNHCVANYYTDGETALGAHKDKTLDLDPSHPILLVSVGAPRVLVLQRRSGESTAGTSTSGTEVLEEQHITLRHGSCFILGPKTNKRWTHAVPTKPGPMTHVIERLSLTLRSVSTHARKLDPDTGEPIGLSGRGKDFQTVEWPGDKARVL